MEVILKELPAFDPAHPNYERWKRGREIAEERGRFVELILSEEIKCEGLKILDLGSGEGGTSKILSQKNIVVSLDKQSVRLSRQQPFEKFLKVKADAVEIPFKNYSFDLVILQDVIEHLQIQSALIDELYSI